MSMCFSVAHQRESAAVLFLKEIHLCVEVVHIREDFLSVPVENFSVAVEPNLPTDFIEQRCTELAFKLPDNLSQVGLGNTEQFGGL